MLYPFRHFGHCRHEESSVMVVMVAALLTLFCWLITLPLISSAEQYADVFHSKQLVKICEKVPYPTESWDTEASVVSKFKSGTGT